MKANWLYQFNSGMVYAAVDKFERDVQIRIKYLATFAQVDPAGAPYIDTSVTMQVTVTPRPGQYGYGKPHSYETTVKVEDAVRFLAEIDATPLTNVHPWLDADELAQLVREREWTAMPGGESLCTTCYRSRSEGHKTDCAVKYAVDALEGRQP